MDTTAEPGQPRGEGPRPTDDKSPSRQRGEPSNDPGGSPARSPQDTRRKPGNEQRYAGWGDGTERVYCARAEQFLPETFPVASHAGAATIPATIVAQRPGGVLLCTFSHHGPHAWPNDELAEDGADMISATGEIP